MLAAAISSYRTYGFDLDLAITAVWQVEGHLDSSERERPRTGRASRRRAAYNERSVQDQ